MERVQEIDLVENNVTDLSTQYTDLLNEAITRLDEAGVVYVQLERERENSTGCVRTLSANSVGARGPDARQAGRRRMAGEVSRASGRPSELVDRRRPGRQGAA